MIRKNKQRILVFLIFSFLIFSCSNPLMYQVLEPKTVTFNSNGGSSVESQTLFKGQTVSRPSNPVKTGNDFSGWYRDNNTFQRLWDFDNVPGSDITLYANWTPKIGWLTPITDAAIIVTTPATGAAPVAAAIVTGNFSAGSVLWSCASDASWNPDTGLFMASTQYTAAVTLTANASYTFTGLTSASINGSAASITNNSGAQVTLSYTFPATTAQAAGTGGITLSFQDFIDHARPTLANVTVSVSGAGYPVNYTLSVNTAELDSGGDILWAISGTTVTGTGAAFLVDATDTRYNNPGARQLTVTVYKDGILYQGTVMIYIIP